jgi:hypothetical protein
MEIIIIIEEVDILIIQTIIIMDIRDIAIIVLMAIM